MTRKELRESVERYLQGKRNERWSDTEINSYLDEAQLEFCRLAKTPETEVSDTLVSSPTPIAASLSVSGRTVTVSKTGHLLAVDNSILIAGSANNERNGGHLITAKADNTFE